MYNPTIAVILEGPLDNGVNSQYNAVHRRLFRSRGLVKEFINDSCRAMVSKLRKLICQRYNINIEYSAAHHPETDCQTEVINKSVKSYLRKAEFALNNRINRAIGMSLFFADFGYHPRHGIEPPSPDETRDPRLERGDNIIKRTRATDQKLGILIRFAQEEYAYHLNRNRCPHPNCQSNKNFICYCCYYL
ncbi:hypothetical protein GcM1_196011 [Golovinomyces cichoracearum]|uniref:Integrase catalytic domain-containing protein n=1 Tax=Golovinomyces cichoracearum TaxID=62708 RepID=A0A420IZW1_9PEZI|nr:hypothetical protein GcM1_196011 [Golovinomyces cichoracearum]